MHMYSYWSRRAERFFYVNAHIFSAGRAEQAVPLMFQGCDVHHPRCELHVVIHKITSRGDT